MSIERAQAPITQTSSDVVSTTGTQIILSATFPNECIAGNTIIINVGVYIHGLDFGFRTRDPAVNAQLVTWNDGVYLGGGSSGIFVATVHTTGLVTITFSFYADTDGIFPGTFNSAFIATEYSGLGNPTAQSALSDPIYGVRGNLPVTETVTDTRSIPVPVVFTGTGGTAGGPGTDLSISLADISSGRLVVTDCLFACTMNNSATTSLLPTTISDYSAFQAVTTVSVGGTSTLYAWDLSTSSPTAAWLVVDEPVAGWTDRSAQLYSGESNHSFTLQARQRGVANYTLRFAGSDPYEPTLWQSILLYDQNASGFTLVFSGVIQAFKSRQIGSDGYRFIDVTAISLEALFDQVMITEPQQFVNETCGAIVTALFNIFESGAPITLGTIQAGATIPLFNAQFGLKLSDIFTQLATTSEFTWNIDPATQQLFFGAPSVTLAPFAITSGRAMWETIEAGIDGSDYRNRQAVRVSYDALSHSKEFIIGAGQKTITLSRPVKQLTNAWATLSTCNTATGTFTGQPSPGDTITIGPATGAWQAAHLYALAGVIVVNGFVQKVTTGGTSGGSVPTFSTLTGATTVDNTVIWTCQGPLGVGTGSLTYTFVNPFPPGPWKATTAYATADTIFAYVAGVLYTQKATTGGTTGATVPAFSAVVGGTVSDGSVVWTCEGICLDNTQLGQIVISDSGLAVTVQNAADAINAYTDTRGVTFSLPTWENPEVNAISVTGTAFVAQQKSAGTGWVAAVSSTGTAFSWSSAQTQGGTSPQGSLGPNEGATITLQVYAAGTSTAAPGIAYTEGSEVITLATPLNIGSNLNVEYTRMDGDIIQCERTDLVLALAEATHGTGRIQQITSADSLGLVSVDALSGLQLCQQALASFDQAPSEIEIEILRPGIYPGMQITVGLTGFWSTLNGDWYVEEVRAEFIPQSNQTAAPYLDSLAAPGAGHYRYTLKLIDVAQIGSYLDWWLQSGGGSGGGGSVGLVATSGGGMAPQNYQPILPVTKASTPHQFLISYDAATGLFVAAQPTDADLSLSNIATNNVSSTKHGFAPISPADATQFLNGAATPAFAAVKDSDLSTSNITTNDVSTSKHGFAPILPNDATKYLDGTGAYSVPAGGGGGGGGWSSLYPNIVAPVLANFSNFNAGTQLTTGSNSGQSTIWMRSTGSGVSGNRGLLKSLPSTPYTIDVGFIPSTNIPSPLVVFGVLLHDPVADKNFTWEFVSDGTIRVQHWTGTNPPTSTPDLISPAGPSIAWTTHFFARLADNGTTRSISVSNDNVNFNQISSEATNTFVTPTQIILYLGDLSNNRAYGLTIFHYWER